MIAAAAAAATDKAGTAGAKGCWSEGLASRFLQKNTVDGTLAVARWSADWRKC